MWGERTRLDIHMDTFGGIIWHKRSKELLGSRIVVVGHERQESEANDATCKPFEEGTTSNLVKDSSYFSVSPCGVTIMMRK